MKYRVAYNYRADADGEPIDWKTGDEVIPSPVQLEFLKRDAPELLVPIKPEPRKVKAPKENRQYVSTSTRRTKKEEDDD